MELSLTINGQRRAVTADPSATLLDLLREGLDLVGTKRGCNQGQCGACTVLVGGRRVLACLTLAASVRDAVTTIEGLSEPGGPLHPMQQAFLDHDALQCGYCTPGQIMSAMGCVREGRVGSAGEVQAAMSGNLCRCAAYPQIVEAVLAGAAAMRQERV
jgi:xanthine dehydrogenase YagT iron-sulfur-binding subunit